MNAAELGIRIKEARIAKKMTQSQVVGNFITRNMLSQIENGIAMPSINTLEYLAEVLELPDILEFLSAPADEDTAHINNVAAAITTAKKAAKDGRWQIVADMETTYPEELEDEFQALLARAFLSLAKSAASGDPALAASYLSKAIRYADQGLYANASIKAEAVLLLQEAAASLTIVKG